ncbi:MAG: ABC transporter permease [Chloroflexota bacterium]
MTEPERPTRHEPLLPNVGYIARREYAALVRGRLFFVSTLVLAGLAMFVAVLPVFAKLVDRGSTTTVAVVSTDAELGTRTRGVLQTMLDSTGDDFDLIAAADENDAVQKVADRELDAAIVAVRGPGDHLSFSFHLGETMGQQQIGTLSLGVFGVAVLDYSARNTVSGFQTPSIEVLRSVGGGGGASRPFDAAAFASRLIVGAVFGFLIFITIVIYGMWVAQGVVAEKASRVMELLVSAASTRQLVIGKALGIGMAGATQTTIVLVPALAVLAGEEAIARLVLGQGVGFASSVSSLSPGLLVGFAVFYVLGFALYSLVYAAAGSLVSRPEDLQIIALPLSIVAIAGYGMGLLALTGGITSFIRLASYVPFWSPFVMLTRLSVGRVEAWELVLSVSILVATILLVGVVAIRIYAAGVLLYGQRPGLRAYVAAARGR